MAPLGRGCRRQRWAREPRLAPEIAALPRCLVSTMDWDAVVETCAGDDGSVGGNLSAGGANLVMQTWVVGFRPNHTPELLWLRSV